MSRLSKGLRIEHNKKIMILVHDDPCTIRDIYIEWIIKKKIKALLAYIKVKHLQTRESIVVKKPRDHNELISA